MTHDDPTCLCIEDIVAALNMAADDGLNWWPPDQLESIAAESVGIDIWECSPYEAR